MFAIEYKNGDVKTLDDIIQIVKDEKRLGRGRLFDPATQLRCVWGVITDETYQRDAPIPKNEMESMGELDETVLAKYGKSLMELNDHFGGTPEERCNYIVSILESLKGEE